MVDVECMLLNKNSAYMNVNMTRISVESGEKKCLKLTRKYQQTPKITAKNGSNKLFRSIFMIVDMVPSWRCPTRGCALLSLLVAFAFRLFPVCCSGAGFSPLLSRIEFS